jgi:hypothetical protein
MPSDNVEPPAPQHGEITEQLEIMLAGKPYIAADKYLCRVRDEMQDKVGGSISAPKLTSGVGCESGAQHGQAHEAVRRLCRLSGRAQQLVHHDPVHV